MGTLDQITNLKNQGLSEDQIVEKLREQKVSPKAIDDAIGQNRIKTAVSDSTQNKVEGMEPSIMMPTKAEQLPTEGSAPSDEELTPPPGPAKIPVAAQRRFGAMTQEAGGGEDSGQKQSGQTQDYDSQQEEAYYPQPQYQQYQPQYQQYQPQEYYPQEEYGYDYGAAGATDTDTMIEISEQVFSEKIKTIQKQVEELIEFKILAQTKIDNIADRLKRIEANIDRLQSAILEKVGSYGRGLDGVKKEMTMMQDSFSKVVGKLTHKPHHIKHRKTPVKRKSSKKKTTRKKKKEFNLL